MPDPPTFTTTTHTAHHSDLLGLECGLDRECFQGYPGHFNSQLPVRKHWSGQNLEQTPG